MPPLSITIRTYLRMTLQQDVQLGMGTEHEAVEMVDMVYIKPLSTEVLALKISMTNLKL